MKRSRWPQHLQVALEYWRWQHPDTLYAQWEERAAIMEYCGNKSREEAEYEAAQLIQIELNFKIWQQETEAHAISNGNQEL